MILKVTHTVIGLAVLSTDLAESSYGQPVIVSPADGSGLGVADAPGTCAPALGETDTGDLCGKWNYANALFAAGKTAERRERAAVARAGRGDANAAAARENGKKGGRPKKNPRALAGGVVTGETAAPEEVSAKNKYTPICH